MRRQRFVPRTPDGGFIPDPSPPSAPSCFDLESEALPRSCFACPPTSTLGPPAPVSVILDDHWCAGGDAPAASRREQAVACFHPLRPGARLGACPEPVCDPSARRARDQCAAGRSPEIHARRAGAWRVRSVATLLLLADQPAGVLGVDLGREGRGLQGRTAPGRGST